MKICFWGNIAGALKGKTDGGGELQQALVAKALALAGHEVIIIDFQVCKDFTTSEGIKIIAIKGWNNGIRIIRTFTHRLPQLYDILKAQKADVYYCRIRDFRHIIAYWAARKVKAKFILGLASDLDVMSFRQRYKHNFFSTLWGGVNGILIEIVYPYLLRNADLVLVQHEGQRDILLKKHIKSQILKNLFVLQEVPQITNNPNEEFVYVGSLNKRKGFNTFFEIVKKASKFSFKIIGQPTDRTSLKHYHELKLFSNVVLLGRLNHSNTINQIANSKALISTSPMEGFPNIFIEAWACGVPVISLYVDPGDVIKNEKLGGICSGSTDKLLFEMNEYRNRAEFAIRAKAYVENNHVLNSNKIKEIDCIFSDVQYSKN